MTLKLNTTDNIVFRALNDLVFECVNPGDDVEIILVEICKYESELQYHDIDSIRAAIQKWVDTKDLDEPQALGERKVYGE